MEADRGSLEPGERADLAVLTADPLSVPAAKLREITSVLTMVAGQTGHDALTAAGLTGLDRGRRRCQ